MKPLVQTGNVYDKYASNHRLERIVMDRFLSRFDRALAQTHPETILEVGMGEGSICRRVNRLHPEARIIGLDLPDAELAGYWVDAGLLAVAGDAYRLPFADNSADVVLAIEVLEHLEHPEAAIAEMSRVGSRWFIFSVPLEPLWRIGNLVRRRYLKDWGNTPGHVQHFSRRNLVSLVSKHLEISEVFQPLPWTMVLARTPDTG